MPRRHLAASRHAFSLLELTLVLAIIGVLMAVAAVNIFGASDRANRKASIASLGVIKGQLQAYYLENKSFPPTLDALVTSKYLDADKMKDAWGTPFAYEARAANPDQPFALISCGPDKTPGNEDDINVWTMNK